MTRSLWMAALALVVLMALPATAMAQMVILVRHAERADAGAPAGATMQASPDPELSEAGKARALKLAAMLKDAGVTAIFTTQFIRTRETARPLAEALKIVPEVVQSRDSDGLVAKIRSSPKGVILVVGHSNSVPAIIKQLGGPEVTIAEDEYDNLFFLAPGGLLTRVRW